MSGSVSLNIAEPTKPIESVPIEPRAMFCARSEARSTAARIARVSSRNASPAAVSATRRRLRSSSVTPSSRSSARICWLSGGWEMCRRVAARWK